MGWIFGALGFALATIYGLRFAGAQPSGAKSAVKTGAVAALALAGWYTSAPAAITLGLALGAAGDFFLSRADETAAGERAFLAGMAAFGAGHLAYVCAFAGVFEGVGWAATLALLTLALSTEFWLAPRTAKLRWPVRCYVLVIAAMAYAALGLPAGQWAARIGAVLFVASDVMLALEIFVLPRAHPFRAPLARALWATYFLGQALILAGAPA